MRKDLLQDVMEDGTPKFVAKQIVGMLMDDEDSGDSLSSDGIPKDSDDSDDSVPMPSDSSMESDDKDDAISIKSAKEPVKRRYYGKRNQLESNWYKRYIEDPNTIQKLLNDPTHRDTKEFKGLFRVDYAVFQLLTELYVTKGWYDPNRKDVCGNKCSDIRLLILGVLNTLGHASSRTVLQSNTNIDVEVHRLFFRDFCQNMASIKDDYIYLPWNNSELHEVQSLYATVGLPGCCGSIDVVHIGWDACPSNLLHLYKGKESYPSIAYEVIVNQKRFIMAITVGHPGARNDKHICRLDDALRSIKEGWLGEKEWWSYNSVDNDSISINKGFYLICDGGYLRWPTLICPIKVSERYIRLSKVIESTRKDV